MELEIQIKKTKKIVLTRDEGWYSEGEMRSELGWLPLQPQVFLANAYLYLHAMPVPGKQIGVSLQGKNQWGQEDLRGES